jgi:hypothetical protein
MSLFIAACACKNYFSACIRIREKKPDAAAMSAFLRIAVQ